jgi:hypothetical protein
VERVAEENADAAADDLVASALGAEHAIVD